MPGSERQLNSPLKDDLGRHLRSASPAIKRPASDMGAQDREEHTADVEMGDVASSGFTPINIETPANSDSKAKQQDTGQRHRDKDSSDNPSVIVGSMAQRQLLPSDSSVSFQSDSLLPTPSVRSTAATSETMDLSPTVLNPPSIDEQVEAVTKLIQEEPQQNQKGYLVSTKWLSKVQARSSHPPDRLKIDKSAAEGPIGPLENFDLALITDDAGKLLDQAGEKFVPLRPGLTLGDDYQVLPQQAWDLIISWYGLAKDSPVLTRYAYDTSEGEAALPNIQYELHPPIFSFLKLPSEHTTQTQKEKDTPPQRMLASKYTPLMTWLKKGKELLSVDVNTKVRVWRILGGLKNTSSSGILTPAASRSASPAPGAEVVASAGDHMLLDVNTFAALQLGEHREKLDITDHTSDPKYNGKSTLATVGLGRDEVIVLEEQKGGPAGGEWPSEHVRISLGKSLNPKDRTKGLTPSGRSSPAPGMTTRGRSRRDGRPRGITGLSNLGNTCYMNSALQCIRSVEELTQYFLHDEWKKDLNPSNPLGHHGEVAKAYANLIKQIYDEQSSSTNPSRFKATIGKYGSSFSGYQQQDSQEFLLFLLDGLQEDLNRIKKKPYIEKPDSTDEMVHNRAALKAFADKNWEDYKARNDSVITDLFAGMYKSTVTCPVCDKVSIIFDPFNNLTLQLPIENNWSKEILYVPLHKRPFRVDVDIDKHSSIRGLKEFVAKRTHADPNLLLVAESYKNKIYKLFDNSTVISEANIQGGDIICVYELDSAPTNYNPNKPKKFSIFSYNKDSEDELVDATSPAADRLLVPVYSRLLKSPGSKVASKPFFGLPSYVVMDRESNKTMVGILKKILGNVAGMTTKHIFEEDGVDNTSIATPEDSDTLIMTDDGSSSGSNHPNASSVQGEDGLVDVSMRDASLAPEAGEASQAVARALQPGTPLPQQLKHLFTVSVASTGEGIPTGWSQINEHNDYDSVLSRVPKPSSKRGKANLNVRNGDSGSTTSDEDLNDIEHDEDIPGIANSDSDSTTEAAIPSILESDGDSNEFRDMQKGRNPKHLKTYKRKGRTILGKSRQQRQTPPPLQPQPQPSPQGFGLIRPGEAIVLDWFPEAYEALFGGSEDDEDEMRGAPTWKSVELLPDVELAAKRAQRTSRKKNGISLEDCLNEFGKSETLSEQNAWYCPRCKEHRRAHKMFELWKAPDILVMHLKRFSSNRNFRDKLEVRVDYPTEGLDLSTMVQDQDDGKSLIYDLIAVDNHYGGLGGGHYTAYAKNFVNDGWYEYNDSHVSSRPDPAAVVTTAAYLLFYRRRTDHPLGGPRMEELLDESHVVEADSEAQRGSREPSPMAGEGQRLGDSSHNGLSSASGAVQAHRVGDGGTATRTKQLHGPTLQDGSLTRLQETDTEEELPPYSAEDPDHRMQGNDDEGIAGLDYSNPWDQSGGWSFSQLTEEAQHPPSADEDMFGDEKGSSNDSTRVENMPSPQASLVSDEDLQDAALYSEGLTTQDDFHDRGMRESAPAPDFVPVPPHDMEDEDDELPVAELKPGDDGSLVVSYPRK